MTTEHTATQKTDFLAPAPVEGGGMMEVAISRAAQEVQAAMVIAKKFPRDETRAVDRIEQACKRIGLAEESAYTYPRGGQTVSGPSIRLAETLAKNWGNLAFGIIELERNEGESTMMAYAWDLETNVRSDKVFQVQHVRERQKGNVNLTDPRDLYELTANQGARRVRSCILSIIPGDVVDIAMEACKKTLQGDGKVPLIDRVRKMVAKFGELDITANMIEKRLGHVLDKTSENELVTLGRIYKTIVDNFGSKADFFDTTPVGSSTAKKPDQSKGAAAPQEQKKKETPTTTKDVLWDPAKPVDSIHSMMKRDSVTDGQVVGYAQTLQLAGAKVANVSEIREANIAKLCENWVTHLPLIQKIPAGE